MIIVALDVIKTHNGIHSPHCAMRIIQNPNGHWYCFDCGKGILETAIKIEEIDD